VHYIYEDINLLNVGVNDMPIHLRSVLSGCEPHIEKHLNGALRRYES
jgi:hypothetical protein